MNPREWKRDIKMKVDVKFCMKLLHFNILGVYISVSIFRHSYHTHYIYVANIAHNAYPL